MNAVKKEPEQLSPELAAKMSGLLPVPDELSQINKDIAETERRLRNMQSGLAEANKTLAGHRAELVTLDGDEQDKLEGLAEAESEARDSRPFRDALDSIRGRRILLTKKVGDIVADQAGRSDSIAKLTDDLSALSNARAKQIEDWRHACYAHNEARYLQSAQYALRQLFDFMIGAGDRFPQLHNPRWINTTLYPGWQTVTHPRGLVFKSQLEAHAQEASND